MKLIKSIIDFIKNLFKQNNKQIKIMAKKSKTESKHEDAKVERTPEEIKQELVNLLCPEEMEMAFKTASVVNEIEQPLILSSSEDFESHRLNMGEMSLGFPTKMLPYMIQALTELYNKNKELKYAGDKKEMKKHDDEVAKQIAKIDYYDLSNEEQSEHIKEKSEKLQRMRKVAEKLMKGGLEELSEEDKAEVRQQLEIAAEISQDAMEKLQEGNLTPEQQQELKQETNEALSKHMKEVESVLLGRRADKVEEIDFEHIKKVYLKSGQQAAKEEIFRVPPEKRDAILAEMLEYMKNNK